VGIVFGVATYRNGLTKKPELGALNVIPDAFNIIELAG
jgi:hypothetical protein